MVKKTEILKFFYIFVAAVTGIIFMISQGLSVDSPPQWTGYGETKTVISPNESVVLYANLTDDIGLSYAWLETNETGFWENKSVYFKNELSKEYRIYFTENTEGLPKRYMKVLPYNIFYPNERIYRPTIKNDKILMSLSWDTRCTDSYSIIFILDKNNLNVLSDLPDSGTYTNCPPYNNLNSLIVDVPLVYECNSTICPFRIGFDRGGDRGILAFNSTFFIIYGSGYHVFPPDANFPGVFAEAFNIRYYNLADNSTRNIFTSSNSTDPRTSGPLGTIYDMLMNKNKIIAVGFGDTIQSDGTTVIGFTKSFILKVDKDVNSNWNNPGPEGYVEMDYHPGTTDSDEGLMAVTNISNDVAVAAGFSINGPFIIKFNMTDLSILDTKNFTMTNQVKFYSGFNDIFYRNGRLIACGQYNDTTTGLFRATIYSINATDFNDYKSYNFSFVGNSTNNPNNIFTCAYNKYNDVVEGEITFVNDDNKGQNKIIVIDPDTLRPLFDKTTSDNLGTLFIIGNDKNYSYYFYQTLGGTITVNKTSFKYYIRDLKFEKSGNPSITWLNSSIERSVIAWRMCFNDTAGNTNCTAVSTFSVGSPKWSDVSYVYPTENDGSLSFFNVTWTDAPGFSIEEVLLEANFTGTAKNYTMNLIDPYISAAENKGVYGFNYTVGSGTFFWRSYARASDGVWNVTDTYYFMIQNGRPYFYTIKKNVGVYPSDHSFSVNITDYDNNTNPLGVTFELGRPDGSVANYTLPDGLILHFTFDSVNSTNYTYDSSGYGHHGQLKDTNTTGDGAPPVLVPGKFEKGIDFDGDGDLVEVSNSLDMVYENMTVALWVWADDQKQLSFAYHNDIIRKNAAWSISTKSTNSFGISTLIGWDSTGTYAKWDSTWTITLKPYSWNFIVFRVQYNLTSYEANYTLTIYNQDGKFEESRTLSNATIVSKSYGKPVYVAYGSGGWYKGKIDEVMIFNRSLDNNEVNMLYESLYPKFYSGTPDLNGLWYINFTQDQLGPAGSYNYSWYAVDRLGKGNSVSQSFTVQKGDPSPYMGIFLDDGTSNVTKYWTQSLKVTGNISFTKGMDDIILKVYNSTHLLTTGFPSSTYTNNFANGTIEFLVNTSGGQNWTSGSSSSLFAFILQKWEYNDGISADTEYRYDISKWGIPVITSFVNTTAVDDKIIVNQTFNARYYFRINNTNNNTGLRETFTNVYANFSKYIDWAIWNNNSAYDTVFSSLQFNDPKIFHVNVSGLTVYEDDWSISRTPISTGTAVYDKYTYKGYVRVIENTSKQVPIIYKIPKSRLYLWSKRSSGTEEWYVNSTANGVSFSEDSDYVYLNVSTSFSTSSLYEGLWEFELSYWVTTSSLGGGGGGGSTPFQIFGFNKTIKVDPRFISVCAVPGVSKKIDVLDGHTFAIKNPNDEPIFVKLTVLGENKDWFEVSFSKPEQYMVYQTMPEYISIEPGKIKYVDVYANVPLDVKEGTYTVTIGFRERDSGYYTSRDINVVIGGVCTVARPFSTLLSKLNYPIIFTPNATSVQINGGIIIPAKNSLSIPIGWLLIILGFGVGYHIGQRIIDGKRYKRRVREVVSVVFGIILTVVVMFMI